MCLTLATLRTARNIKDFTGPTRVVGRLPDLTGQGDADYLVGLLDTAATCKSLKKSDYQPYLGISAEVWQESTAESLNNIFNSSDDILLPRRDSSGNPN